MLTIFRQYIHNGSTKFSYIHTIIELPYNLCTLVRSAIILKLPINLRIRPNASLLHFQKET